MEPLLVVKKLFKDFPGVKALKNVDFDVYPGEVHALVGENGAGKSTLVKCIIGAYKPTRGEIFFQGEKLLLNSPADSSNLGIECVHQELMLIPWLSVTQNIFMNREKYRAGRFFDMRTMNEESRKLLAGFALNIDVSKAVKKYNPSIWKMVDIARVINLNPKLIIFDEPTAILTGKEVESLFSYIEKLKAHGVAIIYISHRMQEIYKLADRVTILRDGEYVGTEKTTELTDEKLVKMMIGRDVSNYYNRNINQPGEKILELENLNLRKGQEGISLNVCRGEIVGLAGLVGAGRTEVAESLIGVNKILSGIVKYKGEEVKVRNPAQMLKRGLVLLPEDRKYTGLILSFSVAFNTVAFVFRNWTKFFYSKKREKEESEKAIREMSIKTPSPQQLVKNLSGGNQQKVVMAKAFLSQSDFLIFDEPTVGVDVGAKEEIHNHMNDFVRKGGAILMVSSDLPEVIGMCDRVYVMYENNIVKEIKREELTEENVARYMIGGGM